MSNEILCENEKCTFNKEKKCTTIPEISENGICKHWEIHDEVGE